MSRRRGRRSRALLLAPLLLTGCAGVHEATGTASQGDLGQLRADVAAVQSSLQRTRAEVDSAVSRLDRRSREQTTETSKQLSALAARIEALQTTINALSTRTDELNQRVEVMRRVPTARPTAPPAVVAPPAVSPPPPTPQTSTGVAGVPPVSPPGATAPPATPAPPVSTTRSTTGALQPQDIYQAAYIDFSKGSYALATAGFREFLRRFPAHELADNAQYWIGETHLSQARAYANNNQPDKASQEWEAAVGEFRKVLVNYPRGDKAPTALYKEAIALLELKKPADAESRLQYLVENFPRAEEAALARDRLASLKQ